MGRSGEAGIAAPAHSAARCHLSLLRSHEVRDQLAGRGVRHQGADRHLQLDIGAVGAMFLVAGAILPPAGLVIAPVAEIDERRQVRIRDHDHAAAAAAVPPVGAAARDVLFAPEADGAVAAVAGLDVDRNLVNKHNR